MPDSQDPKQVTNNDLPNSQFAGGLINAESVKAGRIGGDIYNNQNIHITNYYYREDIRDASVKPAEDSSTDKKLPCPYRSLYHFSPDDTEYFFGREVFIEELFEATKTRNFIPVLGASGSGKSSVVLAGLVPKLQQEDHWLFTHFRPGSEPFYGLAEALVPLYTPEKDDTDRIAQTRKLSNYFCNGDVLLIDVIAKIQQNHPHHRVLLIADQFEELFTLCNNEKIRRNFLDCLLTLIQSPTSKSLSAVFVATMRADFLSYALSYPEFADQLKADIKLIRSMNRSELSKVIAKPAQKLGITFQDGLIERILGHVESEPGNLPLLEFALTLLWEKRTNQQLTHAAYEAIGEVKGALASHADTIYKKFNATEQQQISRIFLQLVRPGEGTEDTRRVATKAEIGEENWLLVQDLADARKRLVVKSRSADGQETVEVAHEALIREWDKFSRWIESDRAFRTWQEQLRGLIRQWEISRNDEGALLRGVALAKAEEWLQQRLHDISPSEWEFIQMSLTLRDRLIKQEKVRKKRRDLVIIISTIVLRYKFDATQNVCEKALKTCQSTEKTCSIVNHGKWISTSQRPINLTLNCADRDKPYSRRGTGQQVSRLKQELEQEAKGAKSCIFNIYSDGDVLISPDEQQRTLIHTNSTDDGFVIDGLAGEVKITQLGDPQKPANVITLKARQRYEYRFPQPRNQLRNLTNDEKKQVYEEPVVQEFLKCNNWERWNRDNKEWAKEICNELNQYRQALNLQFYRPSAVNVEAVRFDNGIEVLKATVDLTKSGVLVSLGNDEGKGISNSNFNRFLQKNNPVLAMGGVYKLGNWNLRSQGKTLSTGTQSLYTVLVLNSKNQPDMITLTDAGSQLQFEQYLFVLQAGPRLVRQGKATVTKISTETEGHTNLAEIFENRSRRAGIGFSQDKTKLYYVTSTGNSRGLSLRELAEVMASEKIGCWNAMNLDGGDGPALAHDGFVKEPAGLQAQPYLILVYDDRPTRSVDHKLFPKGRSPTN
nr:phosphodiester glycosidase family protein [Nostoc sp. EkiNYC01]